MVSRELIEKFETSDLLQIVNEFFTQHFWVDFASEVMCETSIPNVGEFTRNYCITQICENLNKNELVESGWLFDDEGEEEDWVNNN